jgi:hypothetical protein
MATARKAANGAVAKKLGGRLPRAGRPRWRPPKSKRDTWDTYPLGEPFQIGDRVRARPQFREFCTDIEGTVTRIEPYGPSVQLIYIDDNIRRLVPARWYEKVRK